MKKLIVFAIGFIFLFSSQSFAQKGKEIVVGAGGALTSVWIMNQSFYGEPEIDYAPKIGYMANFRLGYNFTENVSVMTELQYSLQGQKYDGKQSFNGNKYDVARDINLRYLNIPLFFKYGFGDKETKFRFLIGPQIGLLLEATQEYTRDGNKIGTEKTDLDGNSFLTDETEISDRFESMDIGIAVDVGADIHLSDQWFINAGFRGNYGFTDINAASFQIKNIDGEYTPSHNFWGGLYVGINYKIDVQGYSQRSF
ncbi:MAG: PorT family protein [Bacteroidales bacterium]|nr:PorT family protein [Bacteroidales bacterium]MCF8403549.1 PorT family protein [Bacteroidales bacterium]